MKVSFTGTGCSGKSTLLNLCREYYGDEFKYVTEVTRPIARKGFTINEKGGDETQNEIIRAHIENNKLDDVIMDRCIVDGFIYTTWLFSKGNVTENVYNFAWDTLVDIINDIDIIFHTAPVGMKDDGERSTNKRFQKDIDEMMNILLKGKSFSDLYIGRVIYLEGDLEKRFNDIKIAIEQHEHTTTR
tara:strand:+ start:212 stop:772 length:561 start_codon:yes stop_codon:yes gene_type:complete